jgi:hypothetical protein
MSLSPYGTSLMPSGYRKIGNSSSFLVSRLGHEVGHFLARVKAVALDICNQLEWL